MRPGVRMGREVPVVSVVVITYQQVRFIRDTLSGTLTQETPFPYEVVVGEDESTDGTREICQEFEARYPDRMRLFLRDRRNNITIDGRPSERTNLLKTLAEVRGEFVALCEGDDRWTRPDKLARQVAYLRAHPEASGCYHRMEMRRAADESFVGLLPRVDPVSPRRTADLVLGNGIGTASIMYRRSAMPKVYPPAFWHHTPMADLPLHLAASLHGDIHYLPETMGVYRVGSGHWSTRSRLETIDASIRMRELLPILVGDSLDSVLRPYLARRRLDRALACLELGDLDGARATLAKVDRAALGRGRRWQWRAVRAAVRAPMVAQGALRAWTWAKTQARQARARG